MFRLARITGLGRSPACALGLTALLGLSACGGGNDSNATIGGNLTGLTSGLSVVLQDNGGDNLTLNANGSFAFATALGSGSAYSVTVLTQPTGQTCQVASGTGTVNSSGDNVTTVSVACVITSTLGGTVSGLNTGTAVTLSNGSVLLPVATNGNFAFPGTLNVGATYNVTIATQPSGQTCAITGGTGTVTTNQVNSIVVTCS